MPRYLLWAAPIILLFALIIPATTAVNDASTYSNYSTIEVTHYDVDLVIEPEYRSLHGRVTYSLTAKYNGSFVELDAVDMLIDEVFDISRNKAIDNVEVNPKGFIRIPRKFKAGERFQLNVEFAHEPKEPTTTILGVNWADPARTQSDHHAVYTQHAEMNARKTIPCQDIVKLEATYTTKLTVPAPLIAVANGNSRAPIDNGDGTVTYEFNTDYGVPTYLYAFAVGNFEVERFGKYTFYFQPEIAATMHEVMQDIGGIEDFLSDHLDEPLPVSSLSFVVVPDTAYPYSMENKGLIFLNRTRVIDRWTTHSRPRATVAHEIVHQWLGNIVSLKSWRYYFVNEGMTTYMDHVYAASIDEETAERSWNNRRTMAMAQPHNIEATYWSEPDAEPMIMHTDNPNSLGNYTRAPWMYRELENRVGFEGTRWILRQLVDAAGDERILFSNVELATWIGEHAHIYANEHAGEPGIPPTDRLYTKFLEDIFDERGVPRATVVCERDDEGNIISVTLNQNGVAMPEYKEKDDGGYEKIEKFRPYLIGDVDYRLFPSGTNDVVELVEMTATIEPEPSTRSIYVDPRGRKFVDFTYENCLEDVEALPAAEGEYRLVIAQENTAEAKKENADN